MMRKILFILNIMYITSVNAQIELNEIGNYHSIIKDSIIEQTSFLYAETRNQIDNDLKKYDLPLDYYRFNFNRSNPLIMLNARIYLCNDSTQYYKFRIDTTRIDLLYYNEKNSRKFEAMISKLPKDVIYFEKKEFRGLGFSKRKTLKAFDKILRFDPELVILEENYYFLQRKGLLL